MSRELLFPESPAAGMRLEHYTDGVFSFERRTYQQHPPMGMLKPVGLWVSVAGEDDWPSWCRDQEFRLHALEHVSVVTLVNDANVLMIPSPTALDEFHDTFAVDDREGDLDFAHRSWASDPKKYWAMDWRVVAQKFDGLIVTPYLWSRRLDGPMWYYGWDCASGCIWNQTVADASVEVLK